MMSRTERWLKQDTKQPVWLQKFHQGYVHESDHAATCLLPKAVCLEVFICDREGYSEQTTVYKRSYHTCLSSFRALHPPPSHSKTGKTIIIKDASIAHWHFNLVSVDLRLLMIRLRIVWSLEALISISCGRKDSEKSTMIPAWLHRNLNFSHRSSQLFEETLEALINLALIQLWLQWKHTEIV